MVGVDAERFSIGDQIDELLLAVRGDDAVALGHHDGGRDGDLVEPVDRRESQDRPDRGPDRRQVVQGEGRGHVLLARAGSVTNSDRVGCAISVRIEAGIRAQRAAGALDDRKQQVVHRGEPELAGRGAEHETADSLGMAAPHELGDRSTHRVADQDRRAGAERVEQRGDVVGASFQRELVVTHDAAPVSAMVDGDDPIVRVQVIEERRPVETARREQAVEQHDGRRVRCGAAQIARVRRASPGQLDDLERCRSAGWLAVEARHHGWVSHGGDPFPDGDAAESGRCHARETSPASAGFRA